MDSIIRGDCSPIAIVNADFYKALRMVEIENKHQHEPTACSGIEFKSFALLDCSTTVKRNKK